jgi:5-methylcytosine-specific restriction endonuclease McrA
MPALHPVSTRFWQVADGTIGSVSIEVTCPVCGEGERLSGRRSGDVIRLLCEECGTSWERDPSPRCKTCDGDDLQAVVKAVVEKGRGTQLSVVGTQIVHLCRSCDASVLERYNRNRPNPLMPDELPTTNPES